MPVSIRGTAGGSVTLSSGAAATDTTLTLPNTTGTVALTASPTFSGTVTATTVTSPASTALTIQSAGTTAMTLDTSGNLLVGTTLGYGKFFVTQTANNTCAFIDLNSGVASGSCIRANINTVGQTNISVEYQGVQKGSIVTNGSTTAYNTSSDYRLKENVQPLTSGLATVLALKPVKYDWVFDESAGEGFIAHELQAVIPHAVTGEKDAVDEEDNPIHQGVDYSKIVVHLVAAIQELSAKNDALEARLAALEAK